MVHYSRMENNGKINLTRRRNRGGQTHSGGARMESKAAHGRLDSCECRKSILTWSRGLRLNGPVKKDLI